MIINDITQNMETAAGGRRCQKGWRWPPGWRQRLWNSLFFNMTLMIKVNCFIIVQHTVFQYTILQYTLIQYTIIPYNIIQYTIIEQVIKLYMKTAAVGRHCQRGWRRPSSHRHPFWQSRLCYITLNIYIYIYIYCIVL